MTTREGKAQKFVSVPADYAGGIQEGDETPVRIVGGGGAGLGIGEVDAIVWQYDGVFPPTTATTLQATANVDTAVAVGHWCVTDNGDIYKCTDAANQAALVWGLISTSTSVTGYPNTIVLRDSSGYIREMFVFSPSGSVPAMGIFSAASSGINIELGSAIRNFIEFVGVGHFNSDGVHEFTGASAAANRNAQLTELFSSIPTSAGASGTLWNDGGTIKIVP